MRLAASGVATQTLVRAMSRPPPPLGLGGYSTVKVGTGVAVALTSAGGAGVTATPRTGRSSPSISSIGARHEVRSMVASDASTDGFAGWRRTAVNVECRSQKPAQAPL